MTGRRLAAQAFVVGWLFFTIIGPATSIFVQAFIS
jgi:hypothetical protein